MAQVPVTRTLPALLRRELAQLRRTQARVFVATVSAIPDATHLTISFDGQTAVVARLVSYTSPNVGDGVYCLASGPIVVALGRTPP